MSFWSALSAVLIRTKFLLSLFTFFAVRFTAVIFGKTSVLLQSSYFFGLLFLYYNFLLFTLCSFNPRLEFALSLIKLWYNFKFVQVVLILGQESTPIEFTVSVILTHLNYGDWLMQTKGIQVLRSISICIP